MFGIAYLAYRVIMSGLAKIDEAVRDVSFKNSTYDPETGIYYDSKMRSHDATNGNKQVNVLFDPHGRTYVANNKLEKYRDLTQEKMNRELAELKDHPQPGVTVVRWNTRNEEHTNYKDIEKYPAGARYKDIKTGAIYVVRKFRPNAIEIKHDKKAWSKYPISSFYMDIETGMLVRVKDGTYEQSQEDYEKSIKYTKEQIDGFINERKEKDNKWILDFNKTQKEFADKGMKEKNPSVFYRNYQIG